MNSYIARANIDHFLRLLSRDDISSRNRRVANKLLIAEENKLSQDLEHLEFAESRAAECRERLNHLRRLRDCFADGSTDRVRTQGLLLSFEATLLNVEGFCSYMRQKVHARRL